MPRDRPRLWESFKRSLGGSPRGNASEPEVARPETEKAPPFLASDEMSVARPAAESAPVPSQADPTVPDPAAGADEIDATVAEARDEPPAPPVPEASAPRAARLARGLASFSRDNADREKKYRHILSDGDSGGKKAR